MAHPAVSEIEFGTESMRAFEPVSMELSSSWMVFAFEASQRAARDSMAAMGMDLVVSSLSSRE